MWEKKRLGMITCSAISSLITPAKLQLSAGAHDYALKLAAERIKGVAEETPTTFDMERGIALEDEARFLYSQNYAPVEEVGFIEYEAEYFRLGYSPDGLIINQNGAIEIKCPQAKGHLATLIDGEIAGGYMLQMQAGMLAGGLDFVDFVSYNEGLIIKPIRIERNNEAIAKIIEACTDLETKISQIVSKYYEIANDAKSVKTKIAKDLEVI